MSHRMEPFSPRNTRKKQIALVDSNPHRRLKAYMVLFTATLLGDDHNKKFNKNFFDAPMGTILNKKFQRLVMGLSSPYVVVAQFNKQ